VLIGVTFALISGVMVHISLSELLPTARRYDPHDRVTTKALVAGMVVMGTSLVLLEL